MAATTATANDGNVIDCTKLAARLGITYYTLIRWRAAGKILAPLVCSGRKARWDAADVEAWIDAGSPSKDEWEARKQASKATRKSR